VYREVITRNSDANSVIQSQFEIIISCSTYRLSRSALLINLQRFRFKRTPMVSFFPNEV